MSSLVENYIRHTLTRTSASRKTISLTKDLEESLRRDDDVIMNFLQQKDVPSWFRGTSRFQLNAANSLFNALRDDTEQRTTHRVRACIGSIGLNPVISNTDTKTLMRLSRGNDLAFLWFLWELHYKTPSSTGYSVNEQLILSMIAHLDMITTLRELDRILPPPQATKKEIERQRRMEELKLAQSRRRKRYKPDYILPYFEKLRRPKPYGKPLSISMPDFMVSFDSYAIYKNKNHVVANESNRWYGTYKMQTSRRIINNILNEQIAKIFEEFTEVSLKANTIRNMCEHHKVIEELEKSLETELKVIARERCMKHLDLDGKHKEATRNRIAEQLERDVAKYMCKFKKLTGKTRHAALCRVLSNECNCGEDDELNSAADCRILEVCMDEEHLRSTDDECKSTEGRCEAVSSSESKKSNGDKAKLKFCKKVEAKGNKDIANNIRSNRLHQGMGDCAEEEIPKCTQGSEDVICNMGGGESKVKEGKTRISISETQNPRTSDFNVKYMQNYDYGHYDPLTPTHSQTYFQAPQAHKPYRFDYRKVFRFKENTKKELDIKKAFLEALDSGVAMLNRLEDAPPDYKQSVKNCVHKIWRTKVAIKNEEIRRQEELEAKKVRKTPLNYDLDYYDPEDKTLMHNLLQDALNYIAQDHKFVLASMPEAHKLPFLREWIYHRYGKLYTKEARHRELQMSMKIFRALDKITQNVPMPQIKMLGNQLYVDYSCRDYLIKKANYIKKQYYNRLDANIMEQARVFWFAMRPYLCSNGPPRNTYFAYMPSRVLDITRFRLWKPTEFMDAKREWDKRRMLKNKNTT